MKNTDGAVQSAELAGAIACVLNQPPASIGMRLKAEDALAEELGVSHRCLRSALATLVADGILDRKRGSGTYVRGIPSEPPAAEPRVAAISNRLRPHMLFADLSAEGGCSGMGADGLRGRPLRIGLWGALHNERSLTPGRVLAGISSAAQELGHYVSLQSFEGEGGRLLDAAELQSGVRRQTWDGCVINTEWAAHLRPALDEVGVPKLYFNVGGHRIDREPVVFADTLGAFDRAMSILVGEDCRRIAAVCGTGEDSSRTSRDSKNAFLAAGQAHGATCAFHLAGSPWDHSLSREIYVRLSQPGPPDGLYVADDYLLSPACQALEQAGLVPGRDIGVVTLSVRGGGALPTGYEWSRIEFDFFELGRRLIFSLVDEIRNAGHETVSLGLHGRWIPGQTHTRRQ